MSFASDRIQCLDQSGTAVACIQMAQLRLQVYEALRQLRREDYYRAELRLEDLMRDLDECDDLTH